MHDLRDLITCARDGDVEAFDGLVRLFQPMACRYAEQLLGDSHLAEDAVQEALVAAWQELPSLRQPAAFRNWLRRLVYKQCDRIRRRRAERAVGAGHELGLIATEPAADVVLEAAHLRDRIMTAVADLPEHEGTVARLFYWSGLSHTQTGEALDLPAHAVKSRLYSARQRLKETLMAQRKSTPRRQATPASDHPDTHALDSLTRLSDAEFKLLLFNLPYMIKADGFAMPSVRLLDKLERNLPARGGPRLLESIRRVGRRSPSHIASAREHILQRAEVLGASRRIAWPPAEQPKAKAPKAKVPKAPTKRYQRLRDSLPERLAARAPHVFRRDHGYPRGSVDGVADRKLVRSRRTGPTPGEQLRPCRCGHDHRWRRTRLAPRPAGDLA
jgi:RNA polymerase sigma factor (sigma-70 family)